MQFKKILITGGAGFIGSNLALKLLQHGYDVVVMDSLTEQIHGSNPDTDSPLYCSIKNNVEFINENIPLASTLTSDVGKVQCPNNLTILRIVTNTCSFYVRMITRTEHTFNTN